MSNLAIKLPAYEKQTEFNLRRWQEVLNDPFYATLEHRIETDRHGHIIMTPPPAPDHSVRQGKIIASLLAFMDAGHALPECPISTDDGVKAADVAWFSPGRFREAHDARCFLKAPEICIEVLSPSNTPEEMADKKALYFAAGADEVWFCARDGLMSFFHGPEQEAARSSSLCPQFPRTIDC